MLAGMAPRILVTVADPAAQSSPDVQQRKNRLYADAVRRHGAEPVLVSAGSSAAEREAAFHAMDGLLISGGADIDPARYGREVRGSTGMEPDRDALEAAAFEAARQRGVPVLGICRGFQAINVFMGGTLIQHVDGHEGPSYLSGPAACHRLRFVEGSRVARILGVHRAEVNTYHHQAIGPDDLAPGLVAAGWAPSPIGDLVEAFESPDDAFLVAVQCHPERTESTPPAFERLWAAFVAACAGRAVGS